MMNSSRTRSIGRSSTNIGDDDKEAFDTDDESLFSTTSCNSGPNDDNSDDICDHLQGLSIS